MAAGAEMDMEEGVGEASAAGFPGFRGALSLLISCIYRKQKSAVSQKESECLLLLKEGCRHTSFRAMRSFSAEPVLGQMNVWVFFLDCKLSE